MFEDVYYGHTGKSARIVYGENNTIFIQGMAAPVASCMGNGINKGDTVEVSTGQYLGVYENYMLGSFDMWLFMGTDYVASDDPVNNPLGFTFVTHLATERVDDVR